ncbi:POLR protein, partial [Smithornis capensis]|nr:POLR protein [Smithornis capensis]
KAFDTVSHDHILVGLKQKGVEQHIINLIKNMYDNVHTCLDNKKEKSEPIQMWVEVKQGDPMSPLLFSLAIDPLLCKLQECGKGYKYENNLIRAMAFADDIVLLSDSWQGMQFNIKILENFCELTSLKTQGEK